jgi:tetratricopeptide (TPR) repeat protein
MMGLIFRIWSQFRAWDTSAKIALLLAICILLPILGVIRQTTGETRNAFLFAFALLVLVIQGIILWGNRHLVTPYTQAQQLAAKGDFIAARDMLLAHQTDLEKNGKRLNAKSLTLLGNMYRNLGNLVQSEAVLRQAVAQQPGDYFPLYGLGRTLLVLGHFDESLTFIQKSVEYGAPSGVQCDIGFIYYCRADTAAAKRAFQTVLTDSSEVYRRLLAQFLLYHQHNPDANPPDQALLVAGLPFWEAEAQRYAHTPYGQALQPIVDALYTLLKEQS